MTDDPRMKTFYCVECLRLTKEGDALRAENARLREALERVISAYRRDLTASTPQWSLELLEAVDEARAALRGESK